MKIVWNLDAEEPLDLENLVGDIVIHAADTTLAERETYIDSWLDALITGLHAVQTEQSVRVDLPEEPLPLVVEPCAQGVRIAYGAMVINVESLEEFHDALRLAVQTFLQKLSTVEGWEKHPLCSGIRDFVCSGSHAKAPG